jgi:hypothetical protein
MENTQVMERFETLRISTVYVPASKASEKREKRSVRRERTTVEVITN